MDPLEILSCVIEHSFRDVVRPAFQRFEKAPDGGDGRRRRKAGKPFPDIFEPWGELIPDAARRRTRLFFMKDSFALDFAFSLEYRELG